MLKFVSIRYLLPILNFELPVILAVIPDPTVKQKIYKIRDPARENSLRLIDVFSTFKVCFTTIMIYIYIYNITFSVGYTYFRNITGDMSDSISKMKYIDSINVSTHTSKQYSCYHKDLEICSFLYLHRHQSCYNNSFNHTK